MKVEIKEISQVIKELTLTVEAEKINKDYQKALQKVSKMAPPIAGFRKGKAPLSAVEKNYAEYVKEELFSDGIDKYLQIAITENDIKSISEFYPISYEWEKGTDLVAVFKYEVNPVIKLANIDGIKVPYLAESVEDAVDGYLVEMKSKNSQMVEVADEVKNNDTVEFELTFTNDNEIVVETVTFPISGEQDDHDPIVDDAIGKKIGDKFTSRISSYVINSVDIADADIQVSAMVNSIQRLKEPEINDAFAKNLDYDNLATMRESLAKEMASKTEKRNLNELNRSIVEAIVNANDFEVPNIVVANEAYRQGKMYMQGKEPDEQMMNLLVQMVTPQVKEMYVYEALKDEYGFEVTEEQVTALVEKLATFEEMTVEEFKEEHKDLFVDDRIKEEAMFQKILEDLAARVQIVDPIAFAAEKKAELKAKNDAKKEAEKTKKTDE